MTLQSGIPPYEYAIRGGRFRSPFAYYGGFGLSGILVEQAQFVITAERRKFLRISDSTILPDFHVYVNNHIPPSGPYEPKINGTTLANDFYPGCSIFVDNIEECRDALMDLFQNYGNDSDSNTYDFRSGWLRSLYPESASGFYNAFDPVTVINSNAQWAHRLPSESGYITYTSPDVLGASGVIWDVDVGEIMWNPAPYITKWGYGNTHGKTASNGADTFSIVFSPFFPTFQKTNGTIVPLTGREPDHLNGLDNYYYTSHIGSGYIRLGGYVLRPKTSLYLDRGAIFQPIEDFTVISEGIREVSTSAGNIASSVLFVQPTAQSSGVYRVAAVNKPSNYPNTTIPSGGFSQWPPPGLVWPSDGITQSTVTASNMGYQVFDDAVWMTDVSPRQNAIPSGLAILSPFTGHRVWVRYAEVTDNGTQPSIGWPMMVGLERQSINSVTRVSPTIYTPLTAASGYFIFSVYSDVLDKVTNTTSTASNSANGEIPLANATDLHDFFYDGTDYWVTSAIFTGFDAWRLSTSFDYKEKYLVSGPAGPGAVGLRKVRGATANGKKIIYYAESGNLATNIGFVAGGRGSGIFEFTYADSPDPGGGVAGRVTITTPKIIRAEHLVGYQFEAEIMDIFEVTSTTHVTPGVYAIIRWDDLNGPGGTEGSLFLLRIEEGATEWAVTAFSRMEVNVANGCARRELVYIPY